MSCSRRKTSTSSASRRLRKALSATTSQSSGGARQTHQDADRRPGHTSPLFSGDFGGVDPQRAAAERRRAWLRRRLRRRPYRKCSLAEVPNGVRLRVTNDGTPLPPNFDFRKVDSLGLPNRRLPCARRSARQIRACAGRRSHSGRRQLRRSDRCKRLKPEVPSQGRNPLGCRGENVLRTTVVDGVCWGARTGLLDEVRITPPPNPLSPPGKRGGRREPEPTIEIMGCRGERPADDRESVAFVREPALGCWPGVRITPPPNPLSPPGKGAAGRGSLNPRLKSWAAVENVLRTTCSRWRLLGGLH